MSKRKDKYANKPSWSPKTKPAASNSLLNDLLDEHILRKGAMPPTATLPPKTAPHSEGSGQRAKVSWTDALGSVADSLKTADILPISKKTREAISIIMEQAAVQLAQRAVNGPDEHLIRDMKTLINCLAKLVKINLAAEERPEPSPAEQDTRNRYEKGRAMIAGDAEYQEFRAACLADRCEQGKESEKTDVSSQ